MLPSPGWDQGPLHQALCTQRPRYSPCLTDLIKMNRREFHYAHLTDGELRQRMATGLATLCPVQDAPEQVLFSCFKPREVTGKAPHGSSLIFGCWRGSQAASDQLTPQTRSQGIPGAAGSIPLLSLMLLWSNPGCLVCWVSRKL